jgi:hypothetical protein
MQRLMIQYLNGWFEKGKKQTIKIILTLFLLLLPNIPLYSVELSGRVTCDGRGIANVVVTDGLVCVRTDAQGHYSLTSHAAKFVYISTPAGYC